MSVSFTKTSVSDSEQQISTYVNAEHDDEDHDQKDKERNTCSIHLARPTAKSDSVKIPSSHIQMKHKKELKTPWLIK